MTIIAPLTAADHDEWLTLWHGYLEFYEASVSRSVTESTFARIVADDDLHGAIARDDEGRAVGIVHWLTHPATWTTSTYTYLEDLFVSPGTRGGGVGRSLIEHVRAWAEAAGSRKVYWLTHETNTAARALYDRVATGTGFVHYEIPLGR
ncbi:GNAT family N-acetyltransferase [Microbacterium sp. 4R-513]|uniref:GNAT family N-acetyltransferase n=1 Tax=Microbacterium sp. 4R-513 TaxID=2567934 RepID=UPI0013E1DFE1|nr:GNAT family N-acetyltransferase [Microbacterium sp. 4R-513]QIG40384.1 GNAT family N-acetyltransferase [Microbacterium sp. 4R-513]